MEGLARLCKKYFFFSHGLICALTFLCITDLVLVDFILLLGEISYEILTSQSERLQTREVNAALVHVCTAAM